MRSLHMFYIIVVAIVGIVGANSIFTVNETEQAMVLTLGKVDRIIAEPGLKVKTPFLQNVVFYDKRLLETDSSAEEIVTKDKKRAVVDSFSRWRITDAKKFYESVRTLDTAINRIDVIVGSKMRQMLARWDLADIVAKDRQILMAEILDAAKVQALELGVTIEDVRIKRVDLPEDNSRAVFRRMQAEREKEAKEIRAQGEEESQKIKADADRQRTILLAEAKRDSEKLRGLGDAIAIKTYANAYNKDPEFYNLTRSLEAYKKSMTGEDTLLVLDPSVEFFNHFNKK